MRLCPSGFHQSQKRSLHLFSHRNRAEAQYIMMGGRKPTRRLYLILKDYVHNDASLKYVNTKSYYKIKTSFSNQLRSFFEALC